MSLLQMASQDRTTRARDLALNLNRYRDPDPRRSALELTLTAGAFALCWLLMWMTLEFGYWLTLLMALPAAGFLVRLFMIQHDCGHGAFFRNRSTNNWVGRVIGALTLTPYDFWRRSHNIHHASSGNLDHRGIGDITTLTVSEYLALPRWGRLQYRLYRHPLMMFGIGPAYLFLLQYRLPVGLMRKGWQPWVSTMATNVAIDHSCRLHDVARRRRAIPARAYANHAARRLDRRVAILRPAPVRRDHLGRGPWLERARGGVARKLAL